MGQVVSLKEWKSDHPRTITSTMQIGALHVVMTFQRPAEPFVGITQDFEGIMRSWFAMWGFE
jgi:hypothetical protein